MGVLSAFPGPAQRQVTLLFRADTARADAALPDGLRALRLGAWALVELACAVPYAEGSSAEVALLAWRIAVERENGERGTWVVDRWTSARLGAGWPDRWVARHLSSDRGTRRAAWQEEVGRLSVDIRAGERRLSFGSTPVDRPTRSVFVTSRQAEAFLATTATVLNPHPLGRLLDRVALQGGERGLQALALHRLEIGPTLHAEDPLHDLGELEFDSAFRLTSTRRVGKTATESATRPQQALAERPALDPSTIHSRP
ncbi:MAG: hypothetical protein AAFZ65_03690 [Planctomycetota bacterium]